MNQKDKPMRKTPTTRKFNVLKLVLLMTLISSQSFGQVPSDLLNQWNSNTVGGTTYDHCEQWKITYPTGEEDKTLCGEANNEFYYVNPAGDGIVFKTPVRNNNGTTPNSTNIRSELREREVDGGADVYWTTEGYHAIYVKQAFTHLPINKDEVVGTQIHGNKAAGIDDAVVLRLHDKELYLSFNGNVLRPDLTISTNYTLGTIHEVIFEVIDDKHYVYYSEDGNLKSAFQSGNASSYLVKDNGNAVLMDIYYGESYFKVGNYTQSNPTEEGDDTDDPNNYGEVVVYDMYVDHEGPTVVGSECDDTPTNISVSSVGETSATVAWDFVAAVDHYKVRHAVTGTENWVTSGNISAGTYEITGLTSDITYQWQVRAKCADGSGSDYSAGQGADFTPTEVINETCVASVPTNKVVDNIGESNVTFNWTFDPLMDHYNVRFRPNGSSTWTTLTSLRESEGDFTVSGSTASMPVSGLTAETEYEWQLRAKCGDGSASEYADGQGVNFTTDGGNAWVCSTVAPSDILPDLSYFKVTFPIDANGNDYEGVAYADRESPLIKATEVDDLVDWVPTSDYCPYFYAEGNEVVFVAHVAGALTSANAYPRTELRETPNGTNDLWSYQDEHELNATFRITHLPNIKQEVNVLQLKGNTSNSTSGTKEPFRLDYRADGNQGLHITVNESTTVEDIMDYSLGQTIVSRMYVNNGDITIELNNIDVAGSRGEFDTTYTSDFAYGYFKAGCYTQSSIWSEKTGVSAESPDAYGEVRFSQLIMGPTGIITADNEITEFNDQVTVSPNPAQSMITIGNSSGSIVEVYNVNGLLQSTIVIDNNQKVIDVNDLTAGIYFLHIAGGEGTAVKKLIKE